MDGADPMFLLVGLVLAVIFIMILAKILYRA